MEICAKEEISMASGQMTLTDDEERILKVFIQANSVEVSNKKLLNKSGLDKDDFLESLRILEKDGFIERYIEHTTLLAKGRVYTRKNM